jgi:hypothetical protein
MVVHCSAYCQGNDQYDPDDDFLDPGEDNGGYDEDDY